MTKRKAGAQPGNENALKHGHERAVTQLSKSVGLTGLALDMEKAVHDQIETQGAVAVLRQEAERYMAVSRIFFGLLAGVDAEDVETFDRYVKRYGWLANHASRLLKDWYKLHEKGDGSIPYEDLVKEELQS